MSRSPAHGVATHLASIGIGALGGNADWAINVSQLPERPIRALAVVDSGGQSPLLYQENLRRPSVQVLGRGDDLDALWAKMEEVHQALAVDGAGTVVGAYRYVGFDSVGDILALGQDDKGNFLMSANFNVIRHLA